VPSVLHLAISGSRKDLKILEMILEHKSQKQRGMYYMH